MKKILSISSSGRGENALSAHLGDILLSRLMSADPKATHVARDISQGMTFPTEMSISASYTDPDQLTSEQKDILALSDSITQELLACDTLIITTPMYNFGPPAALKAWLDLVIRRGKTFRFKDGGGFEPLAGDRKTYVIVTAGGVPMGAPMDHLTPLLTTALGFIGITSIEYIYVAGTNMPNAKEIIEAAREKIRLLPLS